jgi:hypothetical protein
MNKEKLLTVRWNNGLALGLRIPALIYAVVALYPRRWRQNWEALSGLWRSGCSTE